jgi:hypothetical protein
MSERELCLDCYISPLCLAMKLKYLRWIVVPLISNVYCDHFLHLKSSAKCQCLKLVNIQGPLSNFGFDSIFKSLLKLVNNLKGKWDYDMCFYFIFLQNVDFISNVYCDHFLHLKSSAKCQCLKLVNIQDVLFIISSFLSC